LALCKKKDEILKTRIITAVIALLIFIPILWVGGIWIEIASAVLAFVGVSEIFIMKKMMILNPIAILSMFMGAALTLPNTVFQGHWLNKNAMFYAFVLILLVATVFSYQNFTIEDAGVVALTTFYVGQGFFYLTSAREKGLDYLFFALLLVWTTDIFAYLVGRKIGKHSLNSVISPNKTWEGSIGGTVAAVIVILIYNSFFHIQKNIGLLIIFTIVLSVIGQVGDLVESSMKRHYKVKDSGKILPGHGGILDRFDSFLFVFPCLHLLGFF
jgi:phosphatidate cytidylyltransferase